MRSWHSLIAVCALLSACQEQGFVDLVDLRRIDLPSSAADLSTAVEDAAITTPLDLLGADAAITTTVSHSRELRAAWIATVQRIDFPSRVDLTPTEARTEIATIIDTATAAGLNALFFQVRPESDAFYTSTLEPWSRFVSGTQGKDPGYDPLAIFLELGHQKGIEVHAWINPYRALASLPVTTAANHVTKTNPSAAITYDGAVTMNPADATARAHVVMVITDIVTRYDVDGVVFDDYFYPYPNGTPFPDDASYTAYTSAGGTLGKSDWRRNNVNLLVHSAADAVHATKAWVRFGIAPFGIYRPGEPAGIVGLDSYEEFACDSLFWMQNDWLDYLSPQLYWDTGSSGQPFGKLIDWWSSQAKPGRPIIASLALYKLGTSSVWTTAELAKQVALTRGEGTSSQGQVWFGFDMLRDNVSNVAATFKTVYTQPARPPMTPQSTSATIATPTVALDGNTITLTHAALDSIRGYALYAANGSSWSLTQWIPVGSGPVTVAAGRYAVSAIARGGAESLGVTMELP